LLSVVLVDDHKLIQDGLKRTLESSQQFQVVGLGNTAEDGLFRVQEHEPDLAIFDLGLPDHSGLWLIRRVKNIYPDLPVLILSMHDDLQVVSAALDAGATGYIRKSAPEERFLEAARTVAGGEPYVEPELEEGLRKNLETDYWISKRYLEKPNDDVPVGDEIEVLRLVAAGKSNSQIAQEMGKSLSSVKSKLRSLFRKLKVETRTEAVAAGVRQGILNGDLESP